MSTISRRAFLKTVGVGALSVAAMSVLAGCDNVAPVEPVTPSSLIPMKEGNSISVEDLKITVGTSTTAFDEKVKLANIGNFTSEDPEFGPTYYAGVYNIIDNDIKNASNLSNSEKATVGKAVWAKGVEKVSDTCNNDFVTLSFTVDNLDTENAVKVASMKKLGIADDYITGFKPAALVGNDVFTATCDGTTVTVGSAVSGNLNGEIEKSGSNKTVTCGMVVPTTWKEIKVRFNVPGSTVALEVTVKRPEIKCGGVVVNF